MTTPPLNLHAIDTTAKLLAYNAANWSDAIAFREKDLGRWHSYTWAEYQRRVRLFALGLRELDVGERDVVAIIGDNRPEWVYAEVASHALRAMSLGIYRDALEDEVAYLLEYAGAKVVFAEDEEQLDKLIALGDRAKGVLKFIYWDSRGVRKLDDPRLMSVEELEALGRARAEAEPGLYDALLAAGRGDDVAILCTTSGTTARPKLAMLQAGPFLRHCASYLGADPKGPEDEYVAVLPLSWIMEQIYAIGKSLVCRMRVNFVEENSTLMADMREIGPTFLLLAPRVWEAIAADVRSRMLDASRLKRQLYALGMKLAADGKRSWLADAILFRALRDRLGFTRLRSAATGGQAIGPDTFRFFLAMGVPLRQLYGQTELLGAYTIHKPGEVDFDTVGVAFDKEVEIKIEDPDANGVGEIVTRHPNMMLGYFKNEEATRADIRGGWMHTGDAGYFDKKGHLVVIDRIKDIATTAKGDRFSPQYIENKLKFSPYVAEAVILGDRRDYLAAIVCIRFSTVSKWAEKSRLNYTTYSDLAAKAETTALLRREVEAVNAGLPEAQRIRKVLLLYKELDADDGELTRTRKVRRGVIAEKYADIIETIYSDRPSVNIDTTIAFQDGTRQRIKTTLAVIDLGAQARAMAAE